MLLLKKLIQNNKTLVLADQIVFSGTTFFTNIVLAHLLDIKNFGIYSSIIIFIYLAVSVTNALVVNPFQVSISKMKNETDYTIFNFWMQAAFIALIVIAFQIVFSFPIEMFQNYAQFKLPISVLIIGFLFHDFFRKVFLAKLKVKDVLVLDSLSSSFQIAALAVFYILQITDFSSIILFFALSYVPAFLFGVFKVKVFQFNFSNWKIYIKEHIAQGKWLLMTSFIQWWSGNLFVISSGIFISIEALGAFRLVQSLFGVLNILLQTFENYFLPKAAQIYNESKTESMFYIKSLTKNSALVFGALLLIIFVFSKPLIVLAGGAKYAEYAFVVKGMSILYVLIFISLPIRIAIRTMILNKQFFIGYVFTLLFGLLSFKFLLSTFGISGAIIGLMSSQIILIIFWQFILQKNKFYIWK